jgi:hypothetical protein
MTSPFLLPSEPSIPETARRRLEGDYEALRGELPADLRRFCLERYDVDISGEYAGVALSNPFGKASGQLSLNVRQVRRDAEAGLGFCVLKTVIAEDARGERTMGEWAIPETRMRVERTTGEDGTPGWTVTWKGRGWYESFESYCRFFGEALDAAGSGMMVAASVKCHLPGPGEGAFRREEYRHTIGSLQEVWRSRRSDPMAVEKDFSPTLAGDDRSREQEQILVWLREVPALLREAAEPPGLQLGVKLMNTRFGTAFQVEMFRTLMSSSSPPDFVTYANRLFDPAREFEGKVGVAYGGPDLSRRNLEALREIAMAARDAQSPLPPISATGDILTGKMAAEYALLGATSCQMHTLFQLPDTEFGATTRNKSAAVLHHLLLHPRSGLVAWLLHLGIEKGGTVHWMDLPALGRELLQAQAT